MSLTMATGNFTIFPKQVTTQGPNEPDIVMAKYRLVHLTTETSSMVQWRVAIQAVSDYSGCCARITAMRTNEAVDQHREWSL